MTTLTQCTPETYDHLRSLASRNLRTALRRLITSFNATPDEKLDFKPSETARSIRELMSHAVEGNVYVGGSLGLNLDPTDKSTERADLINQLTVTTEAIASAIEGLSDEQMEGTVKFFGMDMPTQSFIHIDDWHLSRHTGQIDYVQTIYGDMEDRM